ncbi:hypothetical protein N9807_01030 [Candidatus Pelagibacter sp.]|nr:hypothetical protein [Candidatus Pelagibacter sp.]
MKLKIPNNKTLLCISLASFPGNTGSKLHNSGYKILNLNYIYLPIKCADYNKALNIIKNLEFKGCSLSMPLKQKLLNNLDELDIISKKTGSVNTILRKKNKLYGFNTDYYALHRLLKEKKLNIKNSKILILGNGGVARTSYEVVKDLRFKTVYLSSRNLKKYKGWKLKKTNKLIVWKKRNLTNANILINATPIGMKNVSIEKIPVSISSLKKFHKIIDFTVNEKKNNLEKKATELKIDYTSGYKLSFYQGLKQFNIYTKKKINEKKLMKIIKLQK